MHMSKLIPYWWPEETLPLKNSHPLPKSTDFLIVGAGHTGLSAARTVAKRGVSVCVLDQNAPGSGASSRNGGMVGGGHRQGLQKLEKLFGRPIAVAMLREAHKDSGTFLKQLLQEEALACDYTACGRFRGFWHRQDYEITAHNIATLQKLFPLNAEMISHADQHRATASPLYRGGVIFHDHGGFNPYRFHQGLMLAAERAGAKIHGHCVVKTVSRAGDGFLLETSRGNIRAERILLATNGYSGELVPTVSRGVFAIPSFLIATEPLGKERVQQFFPHARMMVETRLRHCYYRPSPDGERILFGGRAALVPKPPHRTQRQLEQLLSETFPDLGSVEIHHHWSGNTGFTFDQVPHIGVHHGIGYALGYSGNGNTMAPYLGHKIALRMLNDPEGETAFATPLPIRWWYRRKPWFMPFVDLLYRLRDVKENWRR